MEIDFWRCVSLACIVSGLLLSAIVSVLLGIYWVEVSK